MNNDELIKELTILNQAMDALNKLTIPDSIYLEMLDDDKYVILKLSLLITIEKLSFANREHLQSDFQENKNIISYTVKEEAYHYT